MRIIKNDLLTEYDRQEIDIPLAEEFVGHPERYDPITFADVCEKCGDFIIDGKCSCIAPEITT